MKTSLDEIWNPPGVPGVPHSPTVVEGKLKGILQGAENDFGATFAKGIGALTATAQGAEKLLRELGEVSTNTALARGQAIALASPGGSALAIQLEDFAGQISFWRSRVQSALENSRQNVRALFSDAGTWAMHFSMVRMTLGTFFMTAAWGLVTLKWNEYNRSLYWAAWAAWLSGGFFLFIFTWFLFKKSKDQKTDKNLLMGGNPSVPAAPAKGWRRVIAKLKTFLGWDTLGRGPAVGIWSPFFFWILLTLLFWWLTCCWSANAGLKQVTWVAVASDLSMQQRAADPKAPLESVGFSSWQASLADIAKALARPQSAPGSSVDLSSLEASANLAVRSLREINLTLEKCCGKLHSESGPGEGPICGPECKRHGCNCRK